VHASFIVIGGGLSGLAAAIRLARYNASVLVLEKHSRVGGLNSYYYRNNRLLETGLHAITNYAEKSRKQAPLNILLRQLKIRREEIGCHQQFRSSIRYPSVSLNFSNDFSLFVNEIREVFGTEVNNFIKLVDRLDRLDPFIPGPFCSARKLLSDYLREPLLADMLLCPILYYGSSWEDDIDLNQFTIMFRAIFQEGLFRPAGTIKNFLDLLVEHLTDFGGTIRLKAGVEKIITKNDTVRGVRLENGEEITCDHLISTAGIDETKSLLGERSVSEEARRLSFLESIFVLDSQARASLPIDLTCIFYCKGDQIRFSQPDSLIDPNSGVITLPFNFEDLPSTSTIEVRTTHLANYDYWKNLSTDRAVYEDHKRASGEQSLRLAEELIGQFSRQIVFPDTFTPLTVERFTGKRRGAIYGSPNKKFDGLMGYRNLVLAGTDQGFLGIVGSMLSGVTMVNRHILSKT